MKGIKSTFISLGKELSADLEAASDLWSWLPSHSVAETYHGGYAGKFMPSVRDVMVEAAMYLAHLRRPLVPPTSEEREWFDTCPCGEGCEANKATPVCEDAE